MNGSKTQVMAHLSKFKEAGKIKFEKTLCVPMAERIPALAQKERGLVVTAITASMKSALDNINIRKGLNEDQLIEIAETIIDQAEEDQLALEDVLLFLGRLVTGQAGTLYDRLDMPTFFELFESYREERFQALRHIRHEEHVNFKAMGDNTRYSEITNYADVTYREQLRDHYKNLWSSDEGRKPL